MIATLSHLSWTVAVVLMLLTIALVAYLTRDDWPQGGFRK